MLRAPSDPARLIRRRTAAGRMLALRRWQGGVTLIEMVVVIAISGILLALVGMFTRTQISSYSDVANRADLADAADTALRRMARELQAALPNSVRLSAGGNMLEFVPVKDAGRYRAQPGGGASDDPADFTSTTDNSFDVFGPPVQVTAGDQLVVFNLGIPGADVYSSTATSSTRRALTKTGTLSNLSYAVGAAQFPFASPQNRFHIVGGPVTLECAPNAANPDLGTLRRHWCYGFAATQPSAFGSLPVYAGCTAERSAVVVAGVSACTFNYAPGALQRNGLVSMRVTLTRNNESITLLHQVDVVNTP
ncbi:prepilin-type N-terminal cleavage/methylation domain-containing protein [Rhodocyclus tenuis]|uniref:Prepilin-type N-terminal cleavage/methylation domain-containing protein n=2 Tax=Rhodocyclus TaxID=1064 RepID=A0A6L5JTY0_RHOTE|nr:prepilin-type N-terminal cleavage/methylation domain-containing protein [Rhodocyclus gracilis]